VIAGCIFLMVTSPKIPEELKGLAEQDILNSSELELRWQRISSRFTVDFGGFDATAPLVALFAGIGIVIGANYAVKRRTDSVIKRHFTHPEDKR